MVGEERTPLLAGQVQRQELQGHGLQVHGLQGHGQVGSEGQEIEVARSWLPWTALALAVLAGVSAGLQVVQSLLEGPLCQASLSILYLHSARFPRSAVGNVQCLNSQCSGL